MNLAQALMHAVTMPNGTCYAVCEATADHGLFQAEINKDMVLMVFGKFPENDTATWRRHTFLMWPPAWLIDIMDWEWRPHLVLQHRISSVEKSESAKL